MKLIVCLIAPLLVFAHTLRADESRFSHISHYIPNVEQVGEGRLSVFVWSVYDAALYAPNGSWDADKPFALSLNYLRDIKRQDIIKTSIDEIKRLGMDNQLQLSQWEKQLANFFPDVSDGTQVTGIYTIDKETIFYANKHYIGKISDPKFGYYFFQIWLSDQSSEPSLRRSLLGNNDNDRRS